MSDKKFRDQVREARFELKKKSYREIQEETAWKWAARAAASYENVGTLEGPVKFETYLLGQEYEHEAIEHAALISDPDVNLVKEVQEALESFQLEAWHELQLAFFT